MKRTYEILVTRKVVIQFADVNTFEEKYKNDNAKLVRELVMYDFEMNEDMQATIIDDDAVFSVDYEILEE